MLHRVEIVPSVRAALRRDIRLGCELVSNRHGARRETLIDLSPRGARLLTDAPIAENEEVMLGFGSKRLGRRIETMARVAHVDRTSRQQTSIGLEFLEVPREVQHDLALDLRNIPPPLPIKPRPSIAELVWIDLLLTWEEDLGDRVNVFEVSDTLGAISDDDFAFVPLAPMLCQSAIAVIASNSKTKKTIKVSRRSRRRVGKRPS